MHRSAPFPTLLLAAVLCGCPTDPDGDPPPPPPTEGELSILTYNVHGLPPELTGDDTTARTEQNAPLLGDYAIAGLQEDFIPENHAILAQASPHATQRVFDDVLEGRYYGSGLAIFADFEETDHHHEHYDQCVGVFDHSSDCLASKGFQRLRIDLGGGAELDLYNTHLEAGGGDEDIAARQSHVEQLLAAMLDQSAGQAVLFMGDTNLHGDDEVDVAALAILTEGAGLVDACDALGCPEPGRIDRFLFRSGDDLVIEPTDWGVEEHFVDADGDPLSDHEAISARFGWELR